MHLSEKEKRPTFLPNSRYGNVVFIKLVFFFLDWQNVCLFDLPSKVLIKLETNM